MNFGAAGVTKFVRQRHKICIYIYINICIYIYIHSASPHEVHVLAPQASLKTAAKESNVISKAMYSLAPQALQNNNTRSFA